MGLDKSFNVGVVGATGLVGQTFIDLLNNRNFPVNNLKLFASQKSQGKKQKFRDKEITIEALSENAFENLEVVFFSSGDDISLEWAKIAQSKGAFVIDNSAAFRMNPNNLLIVPEVNGKTIKNISPQIIANPNCSTIQLVVALNPILQNFGLEDVRVSSYQAVSGAGKEALEELYNQIKDVQSPYKYFPRSIAFNCIPQIGSFNEKGFCREEEKIMKETKKILNKEDLNISAFTVRVPILNAHSEVVWFTTTENCSEKELKEVLLQSPGIIFSSEDEKYFTPKEISGKEKVYIGRLHKDPNLKNTWLMWVVADNLLKGASLNGIQIAEEIFNVNKST